MTIMEAIAWVDGLRHNGCSQEQKVAWLSQLDGKLHRLVLEAHEGDTGVFGGYDGATALDTPLLVGKPFEDLYLYWLEAQICRCEGEVADYNGAIALYNQVYGAFAADYKQTHMPKGKGRRFLF